MTEMTGILLNALSILLSLAVILTLVFDRRRDKKPRVAQQKREEKLLKLYDGLEEMVTEFEEYVKKTREELDSDMSELEVRRALKEESDAASANTSTVRATLGERNENQQETVQMGTAAPAQPTTVTTPLMASKETQNITTSQTATDNIIQQPAVAYGNPNNIQSAWMQTNAVAPTGNTVATTTFSVPNTAGVMPGQGIPMQPMQNLITTTPTMATTGATTPVKRGRGRPRKNPLPEAVATMPGQVNNMNTMGTGVFPVGGMQPMVGSSPEMMQTMPTANTMSNGFIWGVPTTQANVPMNGAMVNTSVTTGSTQNTMQGTMGTATQGYITTPTPATAEEKTTSNAEEALIDRIAKDGSATNMEVMRLLRMGVSVDEISSRLSRSKGEVLLIEALLKSN